MQAKQTSQAGERTQIKWSDSKPDIMLISKIAKRGILMAADFGVQTDRLEMVMDIEACHCNGNPLDLAALLTAKDSDFSHDVFGIQRHINRVNGKLQNCFLPRFTVSEEIAATLAHI